MYIDVHAWIGHYPFRPAPVRTAAELVALMDDHGIDKACVAYMPAVYYHDVTLGNAELYPEIAPYADRLIPVAVINPVYACAIEDLEREVREHGVKMIRLFPRQHKYDLASPESVALLRKAAELGVCVQLPIYLEDHRGRHPLDIEEPLMASEVEKAAMLAPETDFMILNYVNSVFAAPLSKLERPGRIYYDFGKCDPLYSSSMSILLESAGIDNVVFGTNMPLQAIDTQLAKMEYLPVTHNLTAGEIEKIASGNAKRILGL